ncbi:unnamed protein product [Fraxinus pennsylvanica]|uniref:Uncharacterized protein n=1 Tax=Fraxinus pennsylvanica TaxID=56036 RepID=A0AAD2E7P2_9LAMI|nr:unnamed protein product [Fraxinus pennsylvanica]
MPPLPPRDAGSRDAFLADLSVAASHIHNVVAYFRMKRLQDMRAESGEDFRVWLGSNEGGCSAARLTGAGAGWVQMKAVVCRYGRDLSAMVGICSSTIDVVFASGDGLDEVRCRCRRCCYCGSGWLFFWCYGAGDDNVVLLDGGYKKSSLVDMGGPVKMASQQNYEGGEESSCAGENNLYDDIDSIKRVKKVKIRKHWKFLSVIPGLKNKDVWWECIRSSGGGVVVVAAV